MDLMKTFFILRRISCCTYLKYNDSYSTIAKFVKTIKFLFFSDVVGYKMVSYLVI